jgi:signal transduction histidine kinase
MAGSEVRRVVSSLFVIQGRNKGARYDLAIHDGAISIGREAGNFVQLDDNEVSRRHAEIRRVGEQFILGDLKSSNGTYVNSQRVERRELAPGDQIQFGRSVLVFSGEGEDEQEVELVDILPGYGDAGGSRIIRSMAEDDASELVRLDPTDTQNLRLARVRSNLQVMYRTALAVSHTLDIDELLGRILQLVFEWVGADRGCIMLLDPDTRQLQTKARRDRRAGEATSSMAISRTILDYVLQRHEGVLTSDAQDDDRFSSGNSVVRTGVREAICVPMQGRYDTVGVIYVDTTVPLSEAIEQGQRQFSDEHLKLMMAIGHQAALAVEDTTYYSAMVQSERLAAIGQTIATLSHHIKNILQGIRGGSYLVEMGLGNGDQAVLKKGWEIVARNQNKISSLVMDMLSYSKEREPLSVSGSLVDVVSDMVDTVRQRAGEAGTSIEWEPPAGFPELCFDPEGISHAVLNVLTNALDAVDERRAGRDSDEPDAESDHAVGGNGEHHETDDPGRTLVLGDGDANFAGRVTLRLEADRQRNLARITITDNGCGMNAETLSKIFHVFVSTKGSRGTGLGLTVSRKILREHGGDISAKSTPGHGSSFVLEFPMVQPADEAPVQTFSA